MHIHINTHKNNHDENNYQRIRLELQQNKEFLK